MNREEFDSLGLAITPVRGIRSFTISAAGWLGGVVYKQDWLPGENVAHCYQREYSPDRCTHPRKPAPLRMHNYWWGNGEHYELNTVEHDFERCRHGFYAYYDGSNNYGVYGDVTACVEGYGKVLVGTRGFRATKARIVAFCFSEYVPLTLVDRVLTRYPLVGVAGTFEQLVDRFPPTGDIDFQVPND